MFICSELGLSGMLGKAGVAEAGAAFRIPDATLYLPLSGKSPRLFSPLVG
jgi:hypothetical protein